MKYLAVTEFSWGIDRYIVAYDRNTNDFVILTLKDALARGDVDFTRLGEVGQ